MSDTNKRRAFAALSRSDLLLLGGVFNLHLNQRMSMEEMHAALAKSGRALVELLPKLPNVSLAKIGGVLGVPVGGKRGATIARILEATGEVVAPVPAPQVPGVQLRELAPAALAPAGGGGCRAGGGGCRAGGGGRAGGKSHGGSQRGGAHALAGGRAA